jgi:glycerol kinase
MAADLLLALDQGTTSSRAMAISLQGESVAVEQQAYPQIYPQPGWVEHDPEIIWRTSLATARAVVERVGLHRIAAIGVTNQRETTVIWDRRTGKPIHNAIVWQDRRTSPVVAALAEAGHEPKIAERTGLVLDPYFSASKIAWILDSTPGARESANRGELAFGTVDSFLLARLTEGRVHVTDATNASRTSLFDIRRNAWDPELCDLFRAPMTLLPSVSDSAARFGDTELLGGSIPICGVAGDQQAALVGQACLRPGEAKSTYGTGAFVVLNTGSKLVRSAQRLLSTIAYRIDGVTTYAVEGSILSAGSTIQWLRDELRIIRDGAHAGELAQSVPDSGGVYLIPAFAGLGAPYWDAEARGAILGLTRGASAAHIARAALEATCFQTAEVVEAMAAGSGDGDARLTALRVDGGMARNDWFLQHLADLLGVEVLRPRNPETTALGAAALAGVGAGLYRSLEDAASLWRLDQSFSPTSDATGRVDRLAEWKRQVQRVLNQP